MRSREIRRASSTDPRHPAYQPDACGPYGAAISIYVDGEKQRDVITYDMDEGYVDRLAYADGKALVVNDEWVTQRVLGNVEVRWRDEVDA